MAVGIVVFERVVVLVVAVEQRQRGCGSRPLWARGEVRSGIVAQIFVADVVHEFVVITPCGDTVRTHATRVAQRFRPLGSVTPERRTRHAAVDARTRHGGVAGLL